MPRGNPPPILPLPVYITAGGKSSRFGSDKARATVEGIPLIRRIADALAPVATAVTAVADRPGKYADLGLRTIADARPGLGPLGGLLAALDDLPPGHDWLLLVSCDLVAADAAWARTLAAAAGEQGGAAEAAAFRSSHWEPLFALYCRGIRPRVAARLGGERRSLQGLLNDANARAVPLPPDWPATAQVNTPDDLARYLRTR